MKGIEEMKGQMEVGHLSAWAPSNPRDKSYPGPTEVKVRELKE